MEKGERAGSKYSSKRQVWKRNVKSDDSDEDYMLEEDEPDDQSDDQVSLVGDASDEESLGIFVDEEEVEEEETVRKVVRSKSQKRSMGRRKNVIKSSKRRKRLSYDEEEDEDYHASDDDDGGGANDEDDYVVGDASDEESLGSFVEEEEMVRKVVRSKSQKRSIGPRKNVIKRSRKTNRLLYEEEDEVYHDDGDGGGGGDEEEDYDGNGDDEDDNDDDEFTPNELDFSDEEEELPSPKVKSKKRGRRSLKKKGSGRSQKGKTVRKLLKKPLKRKRKGSSRPSKSTSGKSRKSIRKVLLSRGKRKRMAIQKKKAVQCSGSDFVSSESSDYEFTVSEEEREQVKEADELRRRLSSNLRSAKKYHEDAAYSQLRILPTRKGKEKMEEIKTDVGKQVCGICLTEEGKNTVRGTLDCCNHFFCFACIIEWSKVESRCPLCKQRFSTISKPPRSATWIDLRNVVIHVPERDQVYQPSEEELRDYLDPYENVVCTECHEGGDDALMLLCDLCDSPAHTYCVGLAHEVPEGNWYCEVCRPSQAQDLTPAPRANNNALNVPSTFENMSEIDLNITIPETPITPVNGFLVSPRQPSNGSLQAQSPVSSVGVSTLSGRRMVHRLQYLLSNNRTSSAHRRTNFSGFWEDRAAQSLHLETSTTNVGTSYQAEYMDRLQENPSFPAQNRERFPARLSLIREQVLQVPSAADSSAYGRIPGREFFQPCTSRLNWGSGTSMSSLYNRDVDQNAGETTTAIFSEKPTEQSVQRYGFGT